MPVKLRLRRTGAKHQPRYRIVAADAHSPRDGRFIEIIGHYLPAQQPHAVEINEAAALKWLGHGAQPTETVRDLLVQVGIMAKFDEARGKTATAAPAAAPAAPAAVVEPAVEAAPVEAAPVEAAPVEAAPAEPAPAEGE